MSPSANFTTYRLPTSTKSDIKNDAFAHNSYSLSDPRPKAANGSSGLFRFLLCSRPCFHQHSVDAEEENSAATADLDEESGGNGHLENGSGSDLDSPLRTELQVRASAIFPFSFQWSREFFVDLAISGS